MSVLTDFVRQQAEKATAPTTKQVAPKVTREAKPKVLSPTSDRVKPEDRTPAPPQPTVSPLVSSLQGSIKKIEKKATAEKVAWRQKPVNTQNIVKNVADSVVSRAKERRSATSSQMLSKVAQISSRALAEPVAAKKMAGVIEEDEMQKTTAMMEKLNPLLQKKTDLTKLMRMLGVNLPSEEEEEAKGLEEQESAKKEEYILEKLGERLTHDTASRVLTAYKKGKYVGDLKGMIEEINKSYEKGLTLEDYAMTQGVTKGLRLAMFREYLKGGYVMPENQKKFDEIVSGYENMDIEKRKASLGITGKLGILWNTSLAKHKYIADKFIDEVGIYSNRKTLTIEQMKKADFSKYAKYKKEFEENLETAQDLKTKIGRFDEMTKQIFGEKAVTEAEVSAAKWGYVDKAWNSATMGLTEAAKNAMQDIDVKNGEYYYKGVPISLGEQFTSREAQAINEDKFLNTVVAIVASLPTYAVSAGAIGRYLSKISPAMKGMQTSSPFLYGALVENPIQEVMEAGIRSASGQDYTWNDAFTNISTGAFFELGFAGVKQMKGVFKDYKTSIQAEKYFNDYSSAIKEAEVSIKEATVEKGAKLTEAEASDIVRAVPFGDQNLGKMYDKLKFAYLKGMKDPNVRAGIEASAPLPKVPKTALETPYRAGDEQMFEAVKPTKKVAGVAKSIEAKAIEKGMIDTKFDTLADYTPMVINEQAGIASALMKQDMDRAVKMIKGELPVPKELKSVTLLTAMEDYAMRVKDPQLALDLANSPLATEISAAAQMLRGAAERTKDSATMKIQEIIRARKLAVEGKLKGKTEVTVKGEMKTAIKQKIKQAKRKKYDWKNVLDELTCK